MIRGIVTAQTAVCSCPLQTRMYAAVLLPPTGFILLVMGIYDTHNNKHGSIGPGRSRWSSVKERADSLYYLRYSTVQYAHPFPNRLE